MSRAQERRDSLFVPRSPVQRDSLRVVKFDTSHIIPDSLRFAKRDSVVIDSIVIRYIPRMGTITGKIDTSDGLSRQRFLWTDAKNVNELLWKVPGFYWRDLGEAGEPGQLNAFGVDSRGVEILLDGLPMNDPITGTFNMNNMPLEFVDHVEIATGSEAASFGDDGAGVGMNFVSRSYNSIKPYTKIRYVQDPKSTLLLDGLFAQNVARGLNLMFAFQRPTSQGLYTNSSLDAWNVRTRLRYDLSDRLNISLMEFFTQAINDMNGGVNILVPYSQDVFSGTGSYVVHPFAWDKITRNDVSLSAIMRVLPDSASLTQMSLFYTTYEREFNKSEYYYDAYYNDLGTIDDFARANVLGARVQQNIFFLPVSGWIGVQTMRRQTDRTRILPIVDETENSVFGKLSLPLDDILISSVSTEYKTLRGKTATNFGGNVVLNPLSWFSVSFDAAWFDRLPTIQELYWTDSTILRPSAIQKERHTLYQIGMRMFNDSTVDVHVGAFQRLVDNAINYSSSTTSSGTAATIISNIAKEKILGITGSARVCWKWFEAYGTMTLTKTTQNDTLKTLIPDVLLSGELSYRNKALLGVYDVRLGVRSSFYNRQDGMTLIPSLLAYQAYQSQEFNLGRTTTLDIFLVLKIGDAHVSLSYLNAMNLRYMQTPIYPMPPAAIRIGVNWEFLD